MDGGGGGKVQETRKETRLDPGKSIICQHKSNYLI